MARQGLCTLLLFVSSIWILVTGDELKDLKKEVDGLKGTLTSISRQLMLQQFFTEEKIRNEGFSGIKQIRTRKGGLKNYYSNAQSGSSYCAIHDHANNIRTVGMGEFIGVLNGVEFRTRHNDFRLNSPHTTSPKYHHVEPIPFPEVPPEVMNQPNVSAEIQEMREWFKAWKNSDHSKRDYRKYFQPVLCYLEGAWTTKQGDNIEEPFESDRHSIDASTWFDLQEKVRITSYTGTKSLSENLAFLPTTIMRFENGSTPVFAQWNYRILCHKLKQHVPLTKFRPADDIATRMKRKLTLEQYAKSRSARFDLDLNTDPESQQFAEKDMQKDFLDTLMEEVPGKNNYGGKIYDGGFDAQVMEMDGKTRKDVSRYHRWFRMLQKDAMGRQESHRGYADQFLFASKTTQSRVAGLRMELCFKHKSTKKKECAFRDEKWSYAIPLEIIYLTPLSKWNPYKVRYQPSCLNILNTGDNRTGEGACKTMSSARKFACDKFYYLTPASFYSGKQGEKDPADTARRGGACMLDSEGNGVVTTASGTKIIIPDIEDLGPIRQRYPISPIHGHGSPVWKNLKALTDMYMHNASYHFMKVSAHSGGDEKEITFELATSQNPAVTPHTHYFTLLESEVKKLMARGKLTVDTDTRESHSHTLKIRYNKKMKMFEYYRCGDQKTCGDGHPRTLNRSDL